MPAASGLAQDIDGVAAAEAAGVVGGREAVMLPRPDEMVGFAAAAAAATMFFVTAVTKKAALAPLGLTTASTVAAGTLAGSSTL